MNSILQNMFRRTQSSAITMCARRTFTASTTTTARGFDMGILEIVRCPVSKQRLSYVETPTPHLRSIFDLPSTPNALITAPETPSIKTLYADYPIVDGIAILDPARASVTTYADHTSTNPAGV